MYAPETNDPVQPGPVAIIQPCNEACVCFQRLTTGGWSDFGLCTNPRSPYNGSPVRIGLECRNYQSTNVTPHPRQD